jgi:hypothetical protein
MPGTYVTDAAAPTLLSGTLTSTTTGTAVEAGYPCCVSAELSIGSVSGTSPTLDVELQASDVSNFASGVISLGRFAQKTTASANTKSYLHRILINKRYVRAVATVGGTSPSFGSVSVTLRDPYFQLTSNTSA